ncbi:MAG: ATP-binding protein, partial [Polyangiaceae bacterium]
AGKRAKTSGAYASAQAYFAAGRALLGEHVGQHRYRLSFDLELHRAEGELVAGEMNQAEERLRALAERALGIADRASVVCLAVLLYFSTARSERAVEVALGFLASVGIAWPARPSEEQVRREYEQLQRNLVQHPLDSLLDRPAMSDPASIATMAVLTELFPAAYAVDRYLLELVLLRMTNLSLEQGNCESSSVAYSALNMALGSHFADYRTAYRLGQLACELVGRRGADRFKARVYSCFAAFTLPWFKHLPLCEPLMTHAFQVGSRMGDMAFAAYNSRNLMTHWLVSGAPLAQVQREAEQATAFASQIRLGMAPGRFIGQLELIQKLRGVPAEHALADDGWATQDVQGQPGLAMMVCYHWVFRLEERFFAADYPAALEARARVEGIRWAMRSSIEEAEYEFYAALSCAAVCDTLPTAERERHLHALSKHYQRIALWAAHCPENFGNRKALIGAELARLEGREPDAQRAYEAAARLAQQHGFVQNEGLAHEHAGQFYAARGLSTSADAHLRAARVCYERWGALSKVKQLDERYPQLRARVTPGLLGSRIDAPVALLDVQTVDKASQTLSSEMVLPSLLEKLMRLAVEHAGAERGLLVLLRDDGPHIEAEAITGPGSVDVTLRSVPVTSADLPQSVLQYVLRTHERLVLDDASATSVHTNDPYVVRNHPKSVLCLPIFRQTKPVGALYLENNLTTRAFTADRVAVLDFLASQAAISLENARLYSELSRSEAQLKEAQHLSSTGSFYWRVALDTLEFSEQTYRIYDLDPNQVVTLDSIASRIHPEDLPLLREMIDVARGPASDLDYLYRAQLPDRSVKYLHLVAHGARDKAGQLEYIGAIQDVTPRHLAEEALSKVRSELAHVVRVTTLGALTASIAHEVSQPLSGIVTNSSTCLRMLAANPPNIEGAKETVRRSIRDGHRAADVITRLRALFGNKESTSEPVDLNETAREVIALSWNELQSNRVIPRTELAANLPAVNGDRVQLQQVILNLILNASDAMSTIDDHARQLVIRTELQRLEAGDRALLSVQDAGVGFDPESSERLFDAFYSTKADGMGMGLSVSRSIIESHHGKLWAVPNAGPGATFSFSIPYTPEGAPGEPSAAKFRSPVLPPQGRRVRSL